MTLTPRPRPVVELNGVAYQWPDRPVVVVCVDGGDPAYFDSALEDGYAPTLAAFVKDGFSTVAQGVVPSFTNPNNMSIVTGAPPSVHGVPGNYFLDPATGQGVMMNTPRFLRSETVLGAFSRAGARVAAITAKDKLRTLLGHGVDVTNGSVVFSAEKADLCTLDECGIEDVLGLVGQPLPDIYSAELSMFAVEAAVRIVEERRPDLTYLSLTDYVQHTHPPGSPEMNSFMRRLDDGLGRLAALGATVAVTADHGMSDKARPDGSPNVVYLQEGLDSTFGAGEGRRSCCPSPTPTLPTTAPWAASPGSTAPAPRYRTSSSGRGRCRGLRQSTTGTPHAGSSSCPATGWVTWQSWPAQTRRWAPRRRITTCQGWRVTGCALTAGSPSVACRSSSPALSTMPTPAGPPRL